MGSKESGSWKFNTHVLEVGKLQVPMLFESDESTFKIIRLANLVFNVERH